MTRDDIICVAREAGCTPFRSPEYWDDVLDEAIRARGRE